MHANIQPLVNHGMKIIFNTQTCTTHIHTYTHIYNKLKDMPLLSNYTAKDPPPLPLWLESMGTASTESGVPAAVTI